MTELAHLRVYRFGPGSRFGGQLLTAIERMEAGGDTRLIDALFLLRDAGTGELDAVDLTTGGTDHTLAALLDFRLDPRRRRAVTERTMTDHPGGVPSALIEAIGGDLEPGAAFLAALSSGGAATDLGDAVASCGGRCLADEPVEARTLAEAARRLRVIAAGAGTGDRETGTRS